MNKEKILEFMKKRMDVLQNHIERQFGGDIGPRVHEFREVKYWKEAIERGQFDKGEGE
jgi:hypothetical protein